MKVSDIMTMGAATIRVDGSWGRALRMFGDFEIGSIPVVDTDERLVGIVSESDFFKADGAPEILRLLALSQAQRAERLEQLRVGDIMTASPASVDADAGLEAAFAQLTQAGRRHLPVVRAGKIVGMISRADILGLLAA